MGTVCKPHASKSPSLYAPLSAHAQRILVMQFTGVAITSLSYQFQPTLLANDAYSAFRDCRNLVQAFLIIQIPPGANQM